MESRTRSQLQTPQHPLRRSFLTQYQGGWSNITNTKTPHVISLPNNLQQQNNNICVRQMTYLLVSAKWLGGLVSSLKYSTRYDLPSSKTTPDSVKRSTFGFTMTEPHAIRLGSSSLTIGCWDSRECSGFKPYILWSKRLFNCASPNQFAIFDPKAYKQKCCLLQWDNTAKRFGDK